MKRTILAGIIAALAVLAIVSGTSASQASPSGGVPQTGVMPIN